MFYIICFDISDNKIRGKVVKLLKGYGIRVQKSVFECPNLKESAFLKIKTEAHDLIDHTTDTIRYYPLCKGCSIQVEYTGLGEAVNISNFKVV